MRSDDGMIAASEATTAVLPHEAGEGAARAREASWLRVRGVSQARGGRIVLDAVDLDIRRGEFFTLLGPSGCGKTTLLRLIGGFDMPDTGTIEMAGQDLARLPASKRPINTVFQSYALFPHLDVAENVAFGLRMLGRPKREIADRVAQMLGMMRLGDLAGRRIGQLSGGQQQRVALARALAPAPKLLLLDEPLSALDHKLRQEMQVELKRIQADLGVTFVFVTHDQEEALSMSDRIAIMKGGRILQCDTPQAIYANPVDGFVAGFLGEANFLTGRLRALDCAHATVELMDGQVACVPLGNNMPQPGPVTLMVRPEDVELGKCRGVSMLARLTRRSFLGSDLCLHMHLADGTPIKARSRLTRAAENAQPGEWLKVSIAPERLRIVAGEVE